MLQSLIVQSFDNTGRIVGVGRETAGLGADFVLKTDLRAFQAEYPKPLSDDAGSLSRSEEHTSELQSLMRISYAVFCLKQNTMKPHKSDLISHLPRTTALFHL